MSRGMHARGLLMLGLLTAYALLGLLILEAAGRRLFDPAWQRAAGSATSLRRRAILLPALDAALGWLPSDVRAILAKDIRSFLRDPAQWSQALVFFGLLGLYFSNLRSFRYHTLPDTWRNLIAFLNVFSVSAVLCSFASRFVYPQLSLEGQGFWILGLSPTSTTRLILVKFGGALAGMQVISIVLMSISATMLELAPAVRLVSVAVAAAMALAVTALSTGLGAVFIDLHERNPAAIVSGFGGTLNLVLSLLFMLGAILPFAAVFHLSLTGRLGPAALHAGIRMAAAAVGLLTLLATVLPLWLGARSLAARDY